MKPVFGIRGKLLVWFCCFLSIFYGTILVLFINIKQIVNISENIVNRNYEIATVSKRMIENLLSMEEFGKKYALLKKDDYILFFKKANSEFNKNLEKILAMASRGIIISDGWKKLSETYKASNAVSFGKNYTARSQPTWFPEKQINEWIDQLSRIRNENEKNVEASTRKLNQLGQISARNSLIGLGFSSVVGLIGILFLSYSMIRPLRELIRGIRSVSRVQPGVPIKIRSSDEFGELAHAFNEMSDQLKEEERMRSDFISMLSHEIRTPLTSTRESVNMIAEEVMGSINERQRKFLEIASVEIGRICDLLNHLMKVSRLESSALKIHNRPFNALELAEGCVRRLEHIAEKRNIRFEVMKNKKLPDTMGDPDYLQRVFHNLLDNAIKFSGRGSLIKISINPDKTDKNLVFSVSDNGPGIPKEEQSLIFNKYYQTKESRDHMDGVGLGLNISKSIVRAHKGEIWVESKEGEGSTFYFTIPVVKKG
ncbi:MAG: HAMP domain-containing histidine kinase [Deltaproteobacteria bacterium]|nr:HAMP domain-containing histidine kinase [Deltaproteobacteria bacterium]